MDNESLTGLALQSIISSAGVLTLSLVKRQIAAPGPDEVVVRLQAAPLNPSDLGLLLGPADLGSLTTGGTDDSPSLTANVPSGRMAGIRARLDKPMLVGNEGAGVVIATGANVRKMIGKTVGVFGGEMYAELRKLPAADCNIIPDGASAKDGASMFVNPLTALAMVEALRLDGHRGLVHTAAASNLGQMLIKICQADGIALVNVVRNQKQVELLSGIGATHVVDSNSPNFQQALTDAVAATNATLAFDAIGGGTTANSILHAMEAAASQQATAYSRYGSTTFKQVFTYGSLDTGPTIIDRGFGTSWAIGGFLVMRFLEKIGAEATLRLRARVAAELRTTFASHYTAVISLREMFRPDLVVAYSKRATGEKFLLDPSRD
jgi:NADPH:quinone reductase-like Zn-dependent oxidoreductase